MTPTSSQPAKSWRRFGATTSTFMLNRKSAWYVKYRPNAGGSSLFM